MTSEAHIALAEALVRVALLPGRGHGVRTGAGAAADRATAEGARQLRGIRWEDGMMVTITEMTQAGGRTYCHNTPIWPRARRVILHHTWSPTSAQYRGLSTVQAIQRYHVQERGWSDIGYNLLVAPDGTTFNGRPMTQYGAHAVGQNQHIGVSCIANFDNEDPWAWGGMAQLRACVNILLGRRGVGPEAVFFHRQFADKSCPGTRLDLGAFRAYLAQQPLGPPLVDPAHPKVVLRDSGDLVDCHAVVEAGVTRCDLRPLANAVASLFGGSVELTDHIKDDGKVYIARRVP